MYIIGRLQYYAGGNTVAALHSGGYCDITKVTIDDNTAATIGYKSHQEALQASQMNTMV